MIKNSSDAVCWFHVGDRILGVHDGVMLEYDALTLAPLGIVDVDLSGREIVVAKGGEALVLVGGADRHGDTSAEVLQPNPDGSYWRRFQGNKIARMAAMRQSSG